MSRRLLFTSLFVALVSSFAWYQTLRTVPDGQRPLETVHAGSLETLRADFNRDPESVRVVVLLAPT